ncbi:extracellular solute-binding protein [Bordetella sp. 15P40C-2]|uniref:extracellular solute-binding protein n=1 Tax=Bordetella sp. 15P40C-2 TaxID=2572246 RepID=UPI0013282FC1|nr:extracellular solute-binding protein [Bordetella sp. 15P40C-2]MVW72248.1 extracellular solute-binding protein [Bordetella sp. 15P40C-2]
MKTLQLADIARGLGASPRIWVFSAAMAIAGVAQAAGVEIEVWHTLNGPNKAEFEKLAKKYNKEQKDVTVKLRGFDDARALQTAAQDAIKKKTGPNLIQLEDNRSPDVVSEHKAILPLYQLLAKYPIKDLNWFLPGTSSFIRDSKGRLLAFPWMAEVPVMYYNLDAYKKAGLDPNKPAATWADLQAELLKLRDVANLDCPYASSKQVEVHLENLAPVNKQLYTSNDNGLTTSKTAPVLKFDTLYMRHIALMVSWKRSLLFTESSDDSKSDKLFADGKCGVLTSGSGAAGTFMHTRNLKFGVAPLPYYPQATKDAGRPFVSGSALWAVNGHPQAQEKATADFLAWLSKPVNAAEWHQQTGYLPLTDAAFRASDVSFYNKVPGAKALVDSLRGNLASTSRGFRMAHYDRIQPILNSELNQALAGTTPPVAALNKASDQAKKIAQQR